MTLPSDEWRRCSPRYILSAALGSAIRWLGALIAIVAIYLIYTAVTLLPRASFTDALPFGLGLGGIVGLAGIACIVLLAYSVGVTTVRLRSLRFRLIEDQIEMRSGILRETSMTLPYARINSVETTRGIWDKMFGLTSLACQTASNQGNITLPGIAAEEAETIRTFLLDRASAAHTN